MPSEPLTERVPFMATASLVATLDAAAKECGISRSELIRRRLEVDPQIVRDALCWQNRSADVVEQRADTQPGRVIKTGITRVQLEAAAELADAQPRPQKWQGGTVILEHDGDGALTPLVGAAYGPEPRTPPAFLREQAIAQAEKSDGILERMGLDVGIEPGDFVKIATNAHDDDGYARRMTEAYERDHKIELAAERARAIGTLHGVKVVEHPDGIVRF